MRFNRVLVLLMGLSMVGLLYLYDMDVCATGLTQAKDMTQVKYRTLSKEEAEILRSMFDASYYAENNTDVLEACGSNEEALFKHFIELGVFEGRQCNPEFDVSAYASVYKDLRQLYKDDIVDYYIHYITLGKGEERNICTVEEAVNLGYVVHPFYDENICITSNVVRVANIIGTKDYTIIATVLEAANSGTVVISDSSDDSGFVVNNAKDKIEIEEADKKAIMEKAKNLEKVTTLKANGGRVISIFYGGNGYAAYETGNPKAYEQNFLKKTDGYEASTDPHQVGSIWLSTETRFVGVPYGQVPEGNVDDYDKYVNISISGSVPSGSRSSEYNSNTVSWDLNSNLEVTEGQVFQRNGHKTAEDSNGDDETTYDVGLNIEKNDDGEAVVAVSVYNEENDFAAVTNTSFHDNEAGENQDSE